MNLKVRPFKRDVRGVASEGTIESGEYVASFYGIPFRVPTTGLGSDQWGNYALVQETEMAFDDGFVFKVEIAPEENVPCGCVISFERRDDETIKGLARAKGFDLNSINLVSPPKQVVSVYFNFAGQVDGDAGGVY